MSEIIIENLSRRRFLQGSAGLTLGFCLPAIAAAGGPAAVPRPHGGLSSRMPFCASVPTTA
jgi:isoquinoline 1-oxidoreductase beta subunit